MNSYVDRIKPDSFGITTYLENLRRSQYQIPTFQREVVWDRDQIKRLWDSIFKFYPLGSILVWRTETRLHNHREIGGHPLQDGIAEQEYHYLLDGQQRMTALLTSIYGGSIKGQDGRDRICSSTSRSGGPMRSRTSRGGSGSYFGTRSTTGVASFYATLAA